MIDEVSCPRHYLGSTVECKEALTSLLDAQPEHTADGRYVTGAALYWLGCTFKYVWRSTRKGGLGDLLKARECIACLIGELYGPDGLEAMRRASE